MPTITVHVGTTESIRATVSESAPLLGIDAIVHAFVGLRVPEGRS